MASPKMTLKLLVDKKGQRVMFAETSKDFVDFLFQIFSLPLGTLIEYLGSKQMVGCLGKLKDSIQSLNPTYFQPGIKKNDIFNPKTPFNGTTFLLSYNAGSGSQSGDSKSIYRCSKASRIYKYNLGTCASTATLYPNTKCPGCNGSMNNKLTAVSPVRDREEEMDDEDVAEVDEDVAAETNRKRKAGYVKEVVTYMVMDNLEIKPMSTISSITLINSFNVNDMSQLREKVVSFGKAEALKLLKASLMTDKVLTTLFLGNNYA